MIHDRYAAALALDPEQKRALLASLLRDRARPGRPPEPVPLSSAQRRLWLLDRLDPGGSAYNVPFAQRLRGRLDIGALHTALNDVVARHDVLRAVVSDNDGEPVHRIVPGFVPALPVVDLELSDPLDALLAAESARPFDLVAAPAIRALLVRRGVDDHVLLVTIHHIVFDGWSMGVFNRELGLFYTARLRDVPATILPLRATFAECTLRRDERLAGDGQMRGLAFWREHLADAPPFIDFRLPRDPAVAPSAGGTRSRIIGRATRDALLAYSLEQRATLFTTTLSLFVLLLRRYSGQRDLTVGAAIANRTRSEEEALIGFFVNTLPLRARIDDGATFERLLDDVHATALTAIEHADIPFERVIEELHPVRVASRTPLINVMFVLQNAPAESLLLPGLDVSPIALASSTAKFDLTLQLIDTADGLRASLEYRADLFDAVIVDGMLAAFETLADQVVRRSGASVSRLALLDADARDDQRRRCRTAGSPLSGGRLEALFERRVEMGPDRIAIVSGAERVSYAELNARSNRLAHHLRSLGVARGTLVATSLERGIDAIVVLLAVLKAGGAYVPLDPDYPADRLAFMLSDSAAPVIITHKRFATRFAGAAASRVIIDGDPVWRSASSADPRVDGSADDPAYVMYTSGSTGQPKGVLVAHRGIERLTAGVCDVSIGPADTVAQSSTLSFDAATFEIWAALCNGARIAIVPKETLLAPPALRAAIAAHGVTIMFMTTALFREIVREAPASFAGLRALIVGGEALDAQSVALLLADTPPGQVINAYGPTEATTFATAFAIDMRAGAPATIPIGRPISHTEILILDEARNVLPAGACGQLHIGGPGVALGYLNNAELTRAKFIADPRDPAGHVLYATGDLARLLPGGDVEFLGRLDAQLKVRGFRIEPGEIESVLRGCPNVTDAVVVLREDAPGNVRLVGYLTTDEPGGFETERITQALRRVLPAQCIPDVLVALAHFPLTPNGKLDRAALPLPPTKRDDAAIAGRVDSELHAQLIAMWEALLGTAPIGIHDNFFALGGHSLLALRLIAEIERAFAVRLPLAVLFDRPTIDALARALCDDPGNLNRSPMVLLNADGTAAPLFFLHGSFEGGGFYTLGLARHLGADRPLYVLRPHGSDGGAVPPTIEAIAAECVDLVIAARPHGPYLVGGFCIGGLVAFEMARQLAQRGERVDRVVLLDVPCGANWAWPVAEMLDRSPLPLPRRATALGAVVNLALSAKHFAASRSKRDLVRSRLRKIAAAFARRPATVSRTSGAPALTTIWRTLGERYVPRRYAGRVTVLVSEEARRDGTLTPAGWTSLCRRADVHLIRGDHFSCVTDHIDETARTIAGALEEREP